MIQSPLISFKLRVIGVFIFLMMPVFNVISASDGSGHNLNYYLYKIEGNEVFCISEKKGERRLRVMELIEENAKVKVNNGTTAYLTCPGCEIIKVTSENSPYPVEKEKFQLSQKPFKIIFENFTAALKAFVYPNSVSGQKNFMFSRGGESNSCQTSPSDSEAILFWGDNLMFNWESGESEVQLEVHNTFTEEIIFSDHLKGSSTLVPMKIFSPGYAYEWSVKDNSLKELCRASFVVLTTEESIEIIEDAQRIVTLLPKDADQETKLRLQAGYLISEGYFSDALRLIKSNGF